MKKVIFALAIFFSVNAFSQSVPFALQFENVWYDGHEISVQMVHGNDAQYDETLSWVFRNGKVVWIEQREKSNGLLTLYALNDGTYAVWFLHEDDGAKTDLFFMK